MIVSPVHFPDYRFSSSSQAGESFLDRGFFFCRGSWALALGLMAIAKKQKCDMVRVWFPDYFCREPLDLLRQFPIELQFYPVQKNLEPDWHACEDRVKKESPPDAFVLVHYFGFPNQSERAREFCRSHNIGLVEDCAHMMRPSERIGSAGTFAVFSPWKFYPIPLLGALVMSNELRPFVQEIPARWRVGQTFFWWLKREVQRTLGMLAVKWYRTISAAASSSVNFSAAANRFSLELFQSYHHGVADAIAKKRVENYQSLAEFFLKQYPQMLLFSNVPAGVIPYAFPFVTKEPAQELVEKLVRRGIPAACWPALPEEVAQNHDRYPVANFYATHLVLLPIHQSVSEKNIEYMKSILTSAID